MALGILDALLGRRFIGGWLASYSSGGQLELSVAEVQCRYPYSYRWYSYTVTPLKSQADHTLRWAGAGEHHQWLAVNANRPPDAFDCS